MLFRSSACSMLETAAPSLLVGLIVSSIQRWIYPLVERSCLSYCREETEDTSDHLFGATASVIDSDHHVLSGA